MHRPKVSIVIPTYNRADCLGETLESVRAQTMPDFEAIVIDDGSTDGTRAMFEQQFASDARFKYVYQRNQGVCVARNTGLEHSIGENVAFLDSDDLWKPWKLKAQIAVLDRSRNWA